jgi:hypothetical protein
MIRARLMALSPNRMWGFGIATSAICDRGLSVGLAFLICSVLSTSCGVATADEFGGNCR